jgi:glycyl-tRNA synthetase beta chain
VSALGLAAGRATTGHRFQGAKRDRACAADDYERALATEAASSPSSRARRERSSSSSAKARSTAPRWAEADERVAGRGDGAGGAPTVYVGAFEDEFLAVPAECLTLTMRQNQKYFPLFDATASSRTAS